MSKKRKEERHKYVRERAEELAQSGDYPDWLSIELAIRSEGYEEARSILDDHYIRENLNGICTIAQSDAEKENRNEFAKWIQAFVLANALSLKQEFPGIDFSIRQSGFSIVSNRNQLHIHRVFSSRKLTGRFHITAEDGNRYVTDFYNSPDKQFIEFTIEDLRSLIRTTINKRF